MLKLPRLALGPLLLVLGLALGESQGWPWLVQPLQNQLTERLGRSITLADGERNAHLHFWGGVTLQSPWLEVGVPDWSHSPYLVSARDVTVQLRYTDLWHAWQGQQLVVRSVRASQLDVLLERLPDGRASWQGPNSATPPPPPRLEAVEVPAGKVHVTDAMLGLELQAQIQASGTRLGLQLTARIGQARLAFQGQSEDPLHLDQVKGHFTLQGPSLAAVGAPFGVTLPTTGAFKAQGQLHRGEQIWDVVLDAAQVGDSRLGGNFRFDTRGPLPRLTGTLSGALLRLNDLGPALGAEPAPVAGRAKVLPSRPFDLAALRVMDADVAIALQAADLNTPLLEPLRPLNARLVLSNGVLVLEALDARIDQGHLGGTLALDGQQERAHWVAALNWEGVALQHWIHQARAKGLPPYLSGQLQGHALLQGNGHSTAEILASLQGRIFTTVQDGALSHLLVEASGLDAAEALGVYLQGDRPLPLDCAVADLTVAQGVMRPAALVLDTADTTIWMDGTLSLAQETLDLRAMVAPKDISPLSLRAPLHVGGSFAQPQVSVEKKPLGLKLGSSLLLGLLNPLAALIPLVDVGSSDVAQGQAQICQAHLQKKLRKAP